MSNKFWKLNLKNRSRERTEKSARPNGSPNKPGVMADVCNTGKQVIGELWVARSLNCKVFPEIGLTAERNCTSTKYWSSCLDKTAFVFLYINLKNVDSPSTYFMNGVQIKHYLQFCCNTLKLSNIFNPWNILAINFLEFPLFVIQPGRQQVVTFYDVSSLWF